MSARTVHHGKPPVPPFGRDLARGAFHGPGASTSRSNSEQDASPGLSRVRRARLPGAGGKTGVGCLVTPPPTLRRERFGLTLVRICALAVLVTGCTSRLVHREITAGEERFAAGLTGGDEGGETTHPPVEVVETAFKQDGKGDLDVWVRQGILNNAGLRAAFEKWRAAMERIPQVTALPDPRFTFSYYVENVETRTGPQETAFGLSQTFPFFGKLETRGDIQAKEAERLWALLENQRLQVVEEIKNAYYEYAYLALAVRITEENLALLERLEPVVQRRIQGAGGQDELLRLQVEIGKIENDLDTLRKYRSPLSERLRAAMNRPGRDPLPWPEAKREDLPTLDKETLFQALERGNPELRALRLAIEREKERIDLAELDGLPDFTLGANYIQTGSARSPGANGSGDDPLIFSFSMNLPIWRSKYDAAVREAAAGRAAAISALVQRGNDLRARLDLEFYRYDDALRQVRLYELTLLPRARQALEVVETAYRAGRAGIIDLIDSQRTLLAFQLARERAGADGWQAMAALEALSGGDLR